MAAFRCLGSTGTVKGKDSEVRGRGCFTGACGFVRGCTLSRAEVEVSRIGGGGGEVDGLAKVFRALIGLDLFTNPCTLGGSSTHPELTTC